MREMIRAYSTSACPLSLRDPSCSLASAVVSVTLIPASMLISLSGGSSPFRADREDRALLTVYACSRRRARQERLGPTNRWLSFPSAISAVEDSLPTRADAHEARRVRD